MRVLLCLQGFSPLHTAASHSSFQSHLVTADLLEAGAPLEAVDDEGRTPLMVALEGNRKEAIDVLIAGGTIGSQFCPCMTLLVTSAIWFSHVM